MYSKIFYLELDFSGKILPVISEDFFGKRGQKSDISFANKESYYTLIHINIYAYI